MTGTGATDRLEALADRIGRVIRTHRAAQGRSLGDLARASGLSKTILARIEGGTGNPSVETLWRVSRALRIPLGSLLAEDQAPRIRAIPHGSGEKLHADSGMSAWLLHADGREHRSELFELAFAAGVEQRSEPHLPGVEELIVCVSGLMRAGPVGEQVELGPGDAVWFAADVAHAYAGLRDARALRWMLYPAAGTLR
jgi:XRE family transcriptional regulator, regulator of sulfur utilization